MTENGKQAPSDDDRGKDNVLRQYDFYLSSNEEFRRALRDAAKYIAVEHGQPLMESGKACEAALLVGRGRVRVFVEGENGRVANLYHVHAGELCPINIGACLSRSGAFANAVSDSPVEAVIIAPDAFDRLRDESHELRNWLFDATAARYGEVVTLLRDLITLTVDQRLAEYLLSRSIVRGQVTRSIDITHADLAMEIGTAREVINRRLKTLEHSGVLELSRGSIVILDRAALESIQNSAGRNVGRT